MAFASPASSPSDARFRDVLLRWPSKRPQKGRQAVRDIVDVESWAGHDDDFGRALAWTPGAFTWVRDRAHLVELPALWCRVPVLDRCPCELAEAITTVLVDEGCPAPHLTFQGDAHLTVLWAIEPLRRPRKDAPEQHHFAFRRCLEDWRKAAIKLSFALEPLGARPLDPALVDELMLGFVPLPPPSNSSLLLGLGLHQEAPRLVAITSEGLEPIVIADISKPLGRRHDTRMFATLGINRARSKKEWLRSARSLAALEPQAAGERHRAAVDIVCACVWDGFDYAATLARLRTWAATCIADGTFPFRRGQGDELELLARWGIERLKPGGPNKPQEKRNAKRTTRDDVAAAVIGFLKSEGGTWSGTKRELAQQAALWSLAAGTAALCPLTTLRRALAQLSSAGALIHTVARAGETWASTWKLASAEAPSGSEESVEISGMGNLSVPQGQKGESTWAPGSGFFELHPSGGAAGGILPPAGGGPGGDLDPPPSSFVVAGLVAVSLMEHLPTQSPKPEISRSPRQRRLRLPREKAEGGPRRGRHRGSEGVGLPPITAELLLELADVAPSLDEAARRALLEAARAGLRPRATVLADFAGALRKRATRLRRREVAAGLRPEAVHEEKRRVARELKAEAHQPVDPAPIEDFRRLLRLASTPLHLRPIEDIARRLHDEGLSLLPLTPGTKEPAIARWRELQSEPMRLVRLQQHLQQLGADAGLAIICGTISGVIVADLDDETAVEWAERHLPPTPWRTKTSRGQHWFYRHPVGDIDTMNPPWKGQLQGEGRYVVAPGSLHPDGGRYEALGDWSQPREALPVFDARWLVDVDELRVAREKILKG